MNTANLMRTQGFDKEIVYKRHTSDSKPCYIDIQKAIKRMI
jgi:hypothetical protein